MGIFDPKQVQVPGLLSDDALAQQLKLISGEAKSRSESAPPPNAAFDFADRITAEYLQPSPQIAGGKTDRLPSVLQQPIPERFGRASPQTQAIGRRSDALVEGVGAIESLPGIARVIPGVGLIQDLGDIGAMGTLNEEERQIEAEHRAKELSDREAAFKSKAQMREQLRGLSDEDAQRMGMPIAPGLEAERQRQGELDERTVQSATERSEEAKASVDDKTKQPTQTWWLNAAQTAAKSAAQTGTSALKWPTEVWELTAGRIANGGDIERSEARAWIQTADAAITKLLPGDKARAKDFVTELSSGAGSFAGYMTAGYVATALGAPAWLFSGALGAMATGSQMYEEAEQFGAVGLQKYMALIAGTGLGMTEAIPVDRIFMATDMATGGFVRRMLQVTAAGSATEFMQELSQSLGYDVAAKYAFDPEREIDLQKAVKQGLIGGILGGAGGVAATALNDSGVLTTAVQQEGVEPPAKPSDAEQEKAVVGEIDALQQVFDSTPDLGEADVELTAEELLEAIPAQEGEMLAKVEGETAQQFAGGTIPVGPDGKLEITHFARDVREVLDPAMRGTGPIRGHERNRLFGEDAVDRTYFGVNARRSLTPQEIKAGDYAANRRAGYVDEGLGDIRHTVKVDPDRVYNWFEDPLNLRAQLDRSTPPSEQVTRYERLIKDAGFDGVYISEGTLGQTAMMFTPETPERVVDDRTGMILRGGEQIDPKTVVVPETELQPLPGLTTGRPVKNVVQAARAYAQSRGIPVRRQREYVKADPDRGARIAAAYDKMKHQPNNPKVKAAYRAMIDETLAQYQAVKATGLKVDIIEPGMADPYPQGPKQVLEDLERGHLWLFPTDSGFGTLNEVADNPLLEPTNEKIGDRVLLANDVFRIVHDFFGHGIEGSGFGARGEENAWQSHMRLYTERALPAVTSETRGQNSWVNFGPFGAQNRANQRETVFADQKTGIMPEWTWKEGVEDDFSFEGEDLLAARAPTTPERVKKLTGEVAGLRGVLKHLQPDEQAKLKAQNAQKIVAIFTKLPDPKEMAAVAISGRAKRGWYRHSAEALVNIFGLEDAPRFAGLLAALSPQTSVENNALNALTMWVNWTKAGRPQDEASIRRLLGKSVQGAGTESSVLPAWVPNSITALTTPNSLEIRLSGPKVNSFMLNLQGVVNEVTNDAWMANFANVDQTLFRKTGPAPGKGAGYIAMNAAVRSAADTATRLTGEQWTPAEIQETVWSWAKTLYEKASNLSSSAEDILAAGGLTAEEISATPDFASLFVSGVYRNILEKGGYDLEAIASGAGDDGQSAGRGDPLSAEGSGFAQQDFERNLRRAARRLDALRQRRREEALPDNFEEQLTTNDNEPVDLGFAGEDEALEFFAQQRAPVRGEPLPLFPDRNDQSFDRWFGDSEVTDSQNKPLVVFHGAPTPEGFRVFDPDKVGTTSVLFSAIPTHRQGFFFAENEEFAKGFADQGRVPGKVIPAFLSIQNAFDAREFTRNTRLRTEEIVAKIQEIAPDYNTRFFEDRVGGDDFWEVLDTPEQGDVVVRALRELGYDGIRMIEPNHDTRESESVWVAFDNTQIKSAEENTGAYSQTNPDIFAQQDAGRGPYRAEPTRPQQGIEDTGQAATADAAELSLNKISRNVIRLMNLTARQGRLTLKGSNVMGQYSRRSGAIRIKTWGDLSTIVHEAGHALHNSMGAPMQAFVTANEQRLMDVATALYGGDTNVMPRATHIAEGVAEFFRVYTLNKAFAERAYPQLTAEFDALLDANAPQLKQGLELVGQQFAAWLQLPSAQLIKNMVVPGRQDQGFNAALKELREVGVRTWMSEYARRTVAESVNRYASLNTIVSQMLNVGQQNQQVAIDLKRAEDPRTLIRLARNSGARAMVQLTDGVMGYKSTQSSTRGLRDALLISQGLDVNASPRALDPVREQDFDAYLVSLRALDEYRRMAEGKIERPPLAASLGDVQKTVKELGTKYPEFVEAAQIVNEFGMALWKKQYEAGLMDKTTYTEGLDRRFYVPLQRDMSDKKSSLGPSALTARGGGKIVKRFKGSDRDIVSPFTVLMHKTFALEQIIAENDVKKALAVLSDRAGKTGALVERIPATQMIGKSFTVAEVARQITKDENISEMDAQDLMTILAATIEEGNAISLFRSEQAGTKGENIVFFWENGKLAALQLADGDVGADVVNMMNGVGRENMQLGVELIAATSTVFRTAITSWPDFLIVNFIRDQMSAWILSDVGFKPFATGIRGMGDELRQRSWAKQYNASMGIMGGMNVAALHEARISRDINALRGKGYIAKAFNETGVLGAIKGFANVVELSETGTRLGLFRKAYERAKSDGLNDWDASIEAAYTATDYIDFGLNGTRMTAARRLIPFLNAQLQGLYKMMRVLGADEVRQRKGLKFALKAYFKNSHGQQLSRTEQQALQTGKKAWVKMTSLGLLSAALHFLFEDDPDYQEAGEYLRTTGWVIPMGDGRLFYIPKPFELALIANAVERGLESASDDPQAKGRFMRGVALSMTPPTAPPAIQTLVELAANKDFFTGQEIVPSYMQALAPELQYNNYTSELSKKLGEATGLSPMVIEHVISSLGASAYKDIAAITNSFDPDRPDMDETDAPILRRFVRDARRGSASAQDFWSYASKMTGKLTTAAQTYKEYIERGNEAGANRFLSSLDEDDKAFALLDTHFKTDAKRLNPFYRARQVTTIVSGMRRELVSDLGLEDTTTKVGEAIKIGSTEKQQLDEVLSEIARREMRNTLVATRSPGWADKKQIDVATSIEMLGAVDPRIQEEFNRRMKKAKVYDAQTVFEYWPEVKDRLLMDREAAVLSDIVTIAKVMK